MPALLVPILAARISTGNTLVPTDSAARAREAELTGGSGACMTRGSAWPQTSSTANMHRLNNNPLALTVPGTTSAGMTRIVRGYSGCGNNAASERVLARVRILLSVSYWLDEFKLDWFRFDIMACWTSMAMCAQFGAAGFLAAAIRGRLERGGLPRSIWLRSATPPVLITARTAVRTRVPAVA